MNAERKVKVKVAQSCPTLCDPVDHAVHGILQARIPDWVVFLFCKRKGFAEFWFNICASVSPTLCDSMDWSLPGSSVHGNSPGKNTGVDCQALFQGNLPDPRIEPMTSYIFCTGRQVLYHQRHLRSPKEENLINTAWNFSFFP